MIGLGDTTCTDDELDVLALCPGTGGVPDYVNCFCSGGTAAVVAPAVPAIDFTTYLAWVAGGLALWLLMGKKL